jgi:hypothetical protein
MHTANFVFGRRLSPRRLGMLIVAGVLGLVVISVGRIYLGIQDVAADRVVELNASFKAAPDLVTLKNQSDLVVVGRIAAEGTTRMVAQSGNSDKTAPPPAPPALDPAKADALKQQPAAPQSQVAGAIANANIGTPLTTYVVRVERVVKGNARGEIAVSQLGGKVMLDSFPGGPKLQRTVQFEGDTLMQAGERHVLFLKSAGDGTFFVTGGPQGRLSIDSGGKVHPIDNTAPALRAHAGETLEDFLATVEAAN